MKHTVAQKYKQPLFEITSKMNNHLQDPVSTKTIKRELHAANIYGRVAIRKPLVTATNAFKGCQEITKADPTAVATGELSFTLYFRRPDGFMPGKHPEKHFILNAFYPL